MNKDTEQQRIQLVKDLKEYCKENPDNCEAEKRGISQLNPNNWCWKREDMEALGIKIPETIKSTCQNRLNQMFVNSYRSIEL